MSFAVVLVVALADSPVVLSQTQKFPSGVYQAGRFMVTIHEDGKYQVTADIGKVTGVYVVTGEQVEVRDEGGDFSCPNAAGRYRWKVDGDKLMLVLLEDPCEGRMQALTTEPLVKDRLSGKWSGTWEQSGGQSGVFQMTIEKSSSGTSAGTIRVEANGAEMYSAPIKEASLNGNRMSAKYDSPDGQAEILLEGEWMDNTFAGTWSYRPSGESAWTPGGSWKAARK
jgi:hypothetical protein